MARLTIQPLSIGEFMAGEKWDLTDRGSPITIEVVAHTKQSHGATDTGEIFQMPASGFEKRRPKRPEAPLRAVIESERGAAVGFVQNLTLDGLSVRLKEHHFFVSPERIAVDLFLAASNGPSIFRTEARIVEVDETGVTLRFRPMALAHHNRLKAIIAFVAPNQEDPPVS
ncbi:MAG TPA: hypothetical protein DCR97_01650 [Deltaproteobacteria bacterium]|nr:hypothetical protein [Deltaproteobacteria bacterium]